MKMRLILSILCSLALTATASIHAETSYTQYVMPMVGTQGTGHTFPGACVPFGMIQASPVTGAIGWNYCQEYIYTDTEVWGFTQDHLNGTGCMDLGEVLIMPSTARSSSVNYHSTMDKSTEEAHPGYYTVYLPQTGVRAEVTATEHVAHYRFTYDHTDSTSMYVDLQHGPVWNENQYHSHVKSSSIQAIDDHTFVGYIHNSVWVDKVVFFALSFDHPVTSIDTIPITAPEFGQKRLLHFNLAEGEQLQVKVALSATSDVAALRNLSLEDAGWDFDTTRHNADLVWEQYMHRIDVQGTKEQLQNFYTAFYHALIQPNNIADAGQTPHYSTFSCWDTYRAAHPFYTIVTPDKVNGMVQSIIDQADALGTIPIWGLWGQDNYCMVGNHGVSIIAEAYHKGFRGFDAERAFAAIRRTQTISHPQKSDWETYMKYSYFPTDLIHNESVSSTLESVYDDYAAYDMASLMGKQEDMEYFGKRKEFWRNLFDPETRFMRPRKSDGTWRSPFDPAGLTHEASTGGDYTEGNAWQYTWHVQHDIPALIELMGGSDAFVAKLDTFFTLQLTSTLSDVTGLIGQYAHGNEPSHHVAYLYALAGHPEKTQKLIRQIFDTQYAPRPDGLCGNDDCGQMSAWLMLSALGFYPVDPVCGKFIFGAPQVPSVTIHLTNGNDFTMTASKLSDCNLYVHHISLNGRRLTRSYITYDEIMQGGTLVFEMSKKSRYSK